MFLLSTSTSKHQYTPAYDEFFNFCKAILFSFLFFSVASASIDHAQQGNPPLLNEYQSSLPGLGGIGRWNPKTATLEIQGKAYEKIVEDEYYVYEPLEIKPYYHPLSRALEQIERYKDKVEVIDFSYHDICLAGAIKVIQKAQKCRKLTELYLKSDDIEVDDDLEVNLDERTFKKAIRCFLSKKNVTILDLRYNRIANKSWISNLYCSTESQKKLIWKKDDENDAT